MNVLVIGANRPEVASACVMAKANGAEIRHLETIDAAMPVLRSGSSPDLLLADVELNIESLFRTLMNDRILVPIVAYGIDTDVRMAVRAVKSGASEFLPLPPDEDLIAALLTSLSGDQKTFVFEDQATKDVLFMARKVAPSDASTLITGESGTGKEMVARYVHQHSRRSSERLVSVNCAAIPDNLLESELFGHEKGAFTGANSRRIGKFEEADGGTLLLDEISEMDPRLQAKLLRAIQEREIDRVGGSKPVKVDIRLLATSNRDLPAEVRAGRFREDLLFRLNVVQLELPPLRARLDDLIPLSKLFIQRYASANNTAVKAIEVNAIESLRRYHWPGNVRELENCIHRAVLLSQGEQISSDDIILPQDDAAKSGLHHDHGDQNQTLVGRSVAEVERRLIVDTLAHTLGNRTRAALILGISIRTLRNKLKQYSDEGMKIQPSCGAAADFAATQS
ncbi:MAG: sigma-54 dependent transcriptional regulator [Pseudomonadota bacterium]